MRNCYFHFESRKVIFTPKMAENRYLENFGTFLPNYITTYIRINFNISSSISSSSTSSGLVKM